MSHVRETKSECWFSVVITNIGWLGTNSNVLIDKLIPISHGITVSWRGSSNYINIFQFGVEYSYRLQLFQTTVWIE